MLPAGGRVVTAAGGEGGGSDGELRPDVGVGVGRCGGDMPGDVANEVLDTREGWTMLGAVVMAHRMAMEAWSAASLPSRRAEGPRRRARRAAAKPRRRVRRATAVPTLLEARAQILARESKEKARSEQ